MIKKVTGELAARGRQLYADKLKDLLEPQHTGQFVAIEPDTGNYFLGEKDIDAIQAARAAMPGKHFYLARVGYPTAYKIGGYGLRKRPRE
ncbi:MAG: hypothetical protein HY231_02515 [Acidobacteria bacterium]|nr:hypothetical protein [Acidobacteriota bacterium]